MAALQTLSVQKTLIYTAPGVPHRPFNPTSERAVAILARTDPNEQESVVLVGE